MKIQTNNHRWEKIIQYFKGLPENQLLLVLAFVVGLACGLSAVALKSLIHGVQWLLEYLFGSPEESFMYLLLPGVGMLLALLFVKYIVRDDIGHGVTKALLAVSKKRSVIKPHNTWTSLAASSVTIGFGGSVGAEAPIVYTGAAIGSNIARLLELSYKHRTILLGCGAAGAVAGIFKAPIAGILFTLEILLFNISMTSILPLLMSTVTATTISYLFFGQTVSFSSSVDNYLLGNIPYYILLGVFCGFVSLYFTRTTLHLEDRIKSIQNPYKRWVFSAIALGILIFIFPPLFGEGYDSLIHLLHADPQSCLNQTIFGALLDWPWFVPIFFALVLVFKVFAMSFTNAGGGVGGTFGPTLIVGGIAGFILSRVINLTAFTTLPEANFVLVGMAGLMAGVMQAPMTAIFLIADITGGYALLLPLIVCSTISFATIRLFEPYSIYTKRIAKNGQLLTHDSDQAVLTLLSTAELIERDFIKVYPDNTLRDLVRVVAQSKRNLYPVVDQKGSFMGLIALDDIRSIMFDHAKYDAVKVYELMRLCEYKVLRDEHMESVMLKFEKSCVWNLPVVDADGTYLGFISKSKIFSSYREQLQQVSHD